jgi:hypothetical protein
MSNPHKFDQWAKIARLSPVAELSARPPTDHQKAQNSDDFLKMSTTEAVASSSKTSKTSAAFLRLKRRPLRYLRPLSRRVGVADTMVDMGWFLILLDVTLFKIV